MLEINIWAALVSAIVVFLLGGVWYSKKLFGETWAQESGMTKDKIKCNHGSVAFIGSFLYILIAALAFGYFLGTNHGWIYAIKFGLGVGICFVATSLGTNYLFTNRNYKLFLIDGGYTVMQFLIFGLIIGLWR